MVITDVKDGKFYQSYHLRIRRTVNSILQKKPGGGTPIWNRQGCSSEILNLTPKGDHLGVAKANFDP